MARQAVWMNGRVALFLLADPRSGGWPSFTAHLAHGLRDAGAEPLIFRLGKRTEARERDFGRGLTYTNLAFPDALTIAGAWPSIIAAVGPTYAGQAQRMIAAGAGVVVHDPTELKGELPDALASSRHPVVTIRRTVRANLEERGLAAVMVPHPYQRSAAIAVPQRHHAVAYSRVDWDKRTHDIVAANLLLPEERRVAIYGALNRLYAFNKLRTVDEAWADNYFGGWPATESLWFGRHLAASASVAVDLSVIAQDGGGTQYSFLEAFDAGVPLIIHRGWLTGDRELDEVAPAVAAAISGAEELADILAGPAPDYDRDAAAAILAEHEAARCARLILSAIGAD